MDTMDRELRDWLRSLAEPRCGHDTLEHRGELSREGVEYLAKVATDGTLKSAFAEIAANEPDLAG